MGLDQLSLALQTVLEIWAVGGVGGREPPAHTPRSWATEGTIRDADQASGICARVCRAVTLCVGGVPQL